MTKIVRIGVKSSQIMKLLERSAEYGYWVGRWTRAQTPFFSQGRKICQNGIWMLSKSVRRSELTTFLDFINSYENSRLGNCEVFKLLYGKF